MGKLTEFKKFALRGNVIDMAVGIIIGAAFGGVVNSLVTDVIMPPIGYLTSGVDFEDLRWEIKEQRVVDGEDVPPVYMEFGRFINTVIKFLIVAMAVFLLVKAVNKARDALDRDEEEAAAAPKPPPEDIQLLREIRDALQKA